MSLSLSWTEAQSKNVPVNQLLLVQLSHDANDTHASIPSSQSFSAANPFPNYFVWDIRRSHQTEGIFPSHCSAADPSLQHCRVKNCKHSCSLSGTMFHLTCVFCRFQDLGTGDAIPLLPVSQDAGISGDVSQNLAMHHVAKNQAIAHAHAHTQQQPLPSSSHVTLALPVGILANSSSQQQQQHLPTGALYSSQLN